VAETDPVELLEKIKDFPCPVCGPTEWRLLGDLGNLQVAMPVKTPHGEIVQTTEVWGSLDAFPFICNACGFIRFHATQQMTALSEALPDEAT
jgi:hypothetical protein